MKLHSASIALLGLPAALAAVVATYDNATPTRPDAALRVLEPSPQPTAIGSLVEESWQAESTEIVSQNEGNDSDNNDELVRVQKRAAEAEAAPTVHNTFTHVNKTATDTTVTTITSTSAAPLPAGATEIAIFTAAGVEFTVTSINGVEAVDGKTLTAAGPAQLIGGEYISEGARGSIMVGGQVLTFQELSSSSSYAPRAQSSAAAGSGSSSAAAGGGSAASSTNSPGAAPIQTMGANLVAFIGAMVGAMVL